MRVLGLLGGLLAVSLAVLAAPGKEIRVEVSAIHQLPDNLSGAKFSFVPTREQAASAQYLSCQDQVRKGLVSHGLLEAPLADADLAVGLLCSAVKVEAAAVVSELGAASSFGTNTRGNVDAATGAPSFSSSFSPLYDPSKNNSTAERTRRVTLMLYAVKSASAGKPREVYEGTASSGGPSAEFGAVAPKLIEALLADFPGKSGAVRKLLVPCPDCAR